MRDSDDLRCIHCGEAINPRENHVPGDNPFGPAHVACNFDRREREAASIDDAVRVGCTSVDIAVRISHRLQGNRSGYDWSWQQADAAVTDAFDKAHAGTVSPGEVARIVRAIDERLPDHMRFTVTTPTDRTLQERR